MESGSAAGAKAFAVQFVVVEIVNGTFRPLDCSKVLSTRPADLRAGSRQ